MKTVLCIVLIVMGAAMSEVRGEVDPWTAGSLVDRDGNEWSVDRILGEGRHVVFVFWQSWCASCKKEAPELASASRRFEARAQFIGVVSGPDAAIDETKVDRFIRETGLSYPQIRDKDLRLTRIFEVKATPTIIVMAPDGRVVYRGHTLPVKWNDVFTS